MASFVTGVTVVTTQVRGEVRGMTANAFMSGSLDPPLCVISVALKARMHAFLVEAGHFGVNILARGQETSDRSFRRAAGRRHRSEIHYAGDTPLLAHANATIAAKVIAQHDCGDHSLFVGHIFALRHSDGRHADRSACRQARVADAARKNNLADAGFLVIAPPRIRSRDSCNAYLLCCRQFALAHLLRFWTRTSKIRTELTEQQSLCEVAQSFVIRN